MLPEKIRQVITLGSPFNGDPRATNAWRVYQMASGQSVDDSDHHMGGAISKAPPVPTTAIYSKTDGICAWQTCIEADEDHTENVEVTGSHCGLGHHPAAVYAVTKAIEWLEKYSPPAAAGMTFSEAGPIPAQGNVAQQMFWYTAFTADTVKPGLPVMNEDGTPKWRMAPSPHGAYWKEGQKVGYQDAGSWTLMKSTPADRAKAAWLYAQFVTSKTVDVKKAHVGLTFIRESTIDHESFTERAPKLGGLAEFYRSPARTRWSPTGTNVPDYPRLAQLWWQNIGDASSGTKTAQAALDALCEQQERVLERLERAGLQGEIGPRLNEERGADYWLSQPGSPKARLVDEDPAPITIEYDELIETWQ